MNHVTVRLPGLIAAVLLSGVHQTARAQDAYFGSNATIDYAVNGDTYVGYASQSDRDNGINPTSPTVSLVSGGSLGGLLIAQNSSTVDMSGGEIGDILEAADSSHVNMSGGRIVGFLLAANTSVVDISSGSVRGNLAAWNSGTINFFGTGLSDTLLNANYFGFSEYTLSGRLRDGTIIDSKNLYIQNTGAQFTLNNSAVPEPGSIALFVGLAGTVLLVRKRQFVPVAK